MARRRRSTGSRRRRPTGSRRRRSTGSRRPRRRRSTGSRRPRRRRSTGSRRPRRRKSTGSRRRKSTGRRRTNQSRALANFINHIEGRRVVKVSRKGNVRPSAGQAYRDGARVGTRACYDGTCKRLRLDKNGRAYWGR